MKIIFTAIFNGYDELREITLQPGWRAICFTDQDLKSNSWEIIKVEQRDNNFHGKIFREIKTRPHVWLPEHDKSVWVDANVVPIVPLDDLIKDKNGFWLMVHPDRNCIYDEAKRCIELGKDSKDVIEKQMYGYLLKSYPHNNGLSATGVLVRDNNEINQLVGESWWYEIRYGSVRDQLSFNYVAWKHGLKFSMFPFLQGFNYFYHPHRIKEMEEKEKLRKLHTNREIRRKKLWAKKTAAYYKLYGNGQNGDNSKTY